MSYSVVGQDVGARGPWAPGADKHCRGQGLVSVDPRWDECMDEYTAKYYADGGKSKGGPSMSGALGVAAVIAVAALLAGGR